jgi:hypothetical protein
MRIRQGEAENLPAPEYRMPAGERHGIGDDAGVAGPLRPGLSRMRPSVCKVGPRKDRCATLFGDYAFITAQTDD